MIEKIKNIADITTGIYTKTNSIGEVYYLQARDFDRYRVLKTNLEPNVRWDRNIKKHFLNAGNILIAAKGFDHFAATYKEEVKPAVASSMFIVLLNIDHSKVLPEFLSWYINHPNIQTFLKSMAKGTNLPSINKKIIGDTELNIPSLENQQAILKVSELRKKEKQLKNKIEILREAFINQQLINILNK